MFRAAASLLILCTLSSSIDAAVDLAHAFHADGAGAHDLHDPHWSDFGAGNDGSGDDASQHFCHCMAHAPMLGTTVDVDVLPARASTATRVAELFLSPRIRPPVRPPKH
jgi:hypothetical protein